MVGMPVPAARGEHARQDRLLSLLRSHEPISVEQLAGSLAVAPATIRRDLHRLAQVGRVVRTYGGAILRPSPDARAAVLAVEEKRWIGAAAAALVRDGQTIVISSGTTTLEMARHLGGRYRDITVITNSLDVARVLLDVDGIELIVLGGSVRPGMHSLLGHLTDMTARELRADALFMGIPAISLRHGLMSDFMPEVLTDRALRKMAGDVVVLADSTKFDLLAPAFVFGLEEVDAIVTDRGIRPDTLEALHMHPGLRVIVEPVVQG